MTQPLPILPHDRELNADELYGFNLACACMATWGRQLASNAVTLGGPLGDIPLQADGKRLASMAVALHRTIGQGNSLALPRPN
jgi:hypothetical protein